MNTTWVKRIEAGVCVECCKPSDGHIRCADCRLKEKQYMHERYESLKARNNCPNCGKKKPDGWILVLCAKCLDGGRERHKKWETKHDNSATARS